MIEELVERLRQTESPSQFYPLCVPYAFLSCVASFAVWPLKVSHLPHFLENHSNGIRRLMRLPGQTHKTPRQPTSTQSGEKILLHSAGGAQECAIHEPLFHKEDYKLFLASPLSFSPSFFPSPLLDNQAHRLINIFSGSPLGFRARDGGDAEDFIGTPSPLLRRMTLMNASLPRAGRVEALQSITHSTGRSREVPVTVASSLKSCKDNLKWRKCKGKLLEFMYHDYGSNSQFHRPIRSLR